MPHPRKANATAVSECTEAEAEAEAVTQSIIVQRTCTGIEARVRITEYKRWGGGQQAAGGAYGAKTETDLPKHASQIAHVAALAV